MAGTTKAETASALEVRRTFPVSRDRVFRAWTEAEELNKWSAPGPATPSAEVDLRVGGRYRIVMHGPDGTAHVVGGVYRVIDPPARLVYSWRWESAPDATESIVTIEFHDRGSSTEVILRHEGLTDPGDRDRHQSGWIGCLDKLSALFDG